MKIIRKIVKVATYGLAALGALVVMLVVAATIFQDSPQEAVQEATQTPAPVAEVAEVAKVIEDQTLPIRLSPTPTICSVSPWTAGKGRRRRIEEAIRLILDCSENRTGV